MYKSKLQEFCHKQSWPLPEYKTVREGADHVPRFTATVTINGVPFQTSAFECRSSKEAQNQAAKLAYDHFTAPKTILQRPNAALPEPSTEAKSNIKTSVSEILLPTKPGQNFQANQPALILEDASSTKGNLYKNRLQNYMQKKNLALPVYTCKIEGPPHARRFKSSVTIDGISYEAPNFSSTLKDAENAAAKVAFEALPPDGVIEDEGLYKSLLQELAHKLGFRFPQYETTKSGLPHLPVFVSSVQVGDSSFQGQEARTKKHAEMSAAKVAYVVLTKGIAEQDSTDVSTVCQTTDVSVINVLSSKTMSTANEMQLDPNANTVLSNGGEQIDEVSGLIAEKDVAFPPVSDIVGASLASGSELQTVVTKELQQQALLNVSDKMESHVKPVDKPVVQEELAEKIKGLNIVETHKSPSPDGHLRSPLESSMVSKTSKPGRRKILVRPYKPNMTYTDGPIVHQDYKYVAMSVNVDQDQ